MIVGLISITFVGLSSTVSDLASDSAYFADILDSEFVKALSKPSEDIEVIALDVKKSILLDPVPMFSTEDQEIKDVQDNEPKEDQQKEQVQKDSMIYQTETVEDLIIPEENVLELPIKILLIGDSLIIEKFGPTAEQTLLTYEGVEVYREGHYSTGLNRVDYYDWFNRTRDLISSYQPDILILYVGANDGQNIRGFDGSYGEWPSSNWDIIYENRVNTYLEEFSPQVEMIYWIGHPIPKTYSFQEKFSKMNELYKYGCDRFDNVIYVNSWDRFALDGKYSATVADDDGLVQYVKASDGVHLTYHGAKILTDLLISYLEEDILLTSIK
jgi:hypothetical protein